MVIPITYYYWPKQFQSSPSPSFTSTNRAHPIPVSLAQPDPTPRETKFLYYQLWQNLTMGSLSVIVCRQFQSLTFTLTFSHRVARRSTAYTALLALMSDVNSTSTRSWADLRPATTTHIKFYCACAVFTITTNNQQFKILLILCGCIFQVITEKLITDNNRKDS